MILRPSYREGFARNARQSKAPHRWEGKLSHLVPYLGVTGDKLKDISGFNNDGVLIGGMTLDDWVIDRNGYVLDYDGIDDRTAINGLINTLAQTTVGTISVWVNRLIDDDTNDAVFSVSNDASATNTDFSILFDERPANDYVSLLFFVDGVVQFNLATPINVLDSLRGEIFNITVVQDGVKPKIYLKGIDQVPLIDNVTTDTTVWFKALLTDATTKSTTANIGMLRRNGADGNAFSGRIGGLFITDKIFTPSEVFDLAINPHVDLELRRSFIGKAPVAAVVANTRRRREMMQYIGLN